jgi:rhodanese-related sulfurtransferase
MSLLFRAALLCVAGTVLGIAGNSFTPRPAPLGGRVLPSSDLPGAVCEQPRSTVARVSVEVAKPLCLACTAVFVDARSAQEYGAGHITGALHLGPGEPLPPVLANLRAAQTVIVYDRDRDCAAADRVAVQLQAQGLRDVRVLTGAWPEWLARGGPGESGACGVCTVDSR